MHDVEFNGLNQVITKSLPPWHELRAAGLVRHMSITQLPLAQLRYINRLGAGRHRRNRAFLLPLLPQRQFTLR